MLDSALKGVNGARSRAERRGVDVQKQRWPDGTC